VVRLAALDGGTRTRFTLTNVLEARDTAARNAAGWHSCLTALDTRAAGPRSGAPPARWEQLYDQYLTAGLPSGAPIPGKS